MSNYDDNGFIRDPLNVRELGNKRLIKYGGWYYEDRHGFTVVTTDGDQFLIPKRQILRYAKIAEKL